MILLLCSIFIILISKSIGANGNGCGQIKLVFYELKQAPWIVKSWGAYHVGVSVCDREIHFLRKPQKYKCKDKDASHCILHDWDDVVIFKLGTLNPMEQIINLKRGGKPVELQNLKRIKDHTLNVETRMEWEQVLEQVEKLVCEGGYRWQNYDLYARNCATFARDLVEAIVDTPEGTQIKWPTELTTTIKGAKILGKFSNIVKNLEKCKRKFVNGIKWKNPKDKMEENDDEDEEGVLSGHGWTK